jgi:hypothetical protein
VNQNNVHTLSSSQSWPAERWAAILVLGALGLLILLRSGVRGVDLLGARVSVG